MPLQEISAGAVLMNGRLTGGAKCCIKGCENDVSIRKCDSLGSIHFLEGRVGRRNSGEGH